MCWKCGKAIAVPAPIGRAAVCETCGADLRSCRNCRFYSPGSYHDCLERVDEAVRDKERSNFCDSFQLDPRLRSDRPGGTRGSPDARSAFDSLFGA
jgi:hypothetical protein